MEFATAGLSVDAWNGYTKGYAIAPTLEDGDTHLEWMHDTVAAVRERWTFTER